ncbi:MAG TPA: hypothetical protein VGD42_15400 [Lysobacter sp.]
MRMPLLMLALAAGLSFPALAAEPEYVPVEQRLSPEQLHATGLDTLSSAQLALLNQLLREDRTQALRTAETQRDIDDAGLRERRAPTQPVVATVNGEVRAWSKGQTVLLDNGQRWRVVDGGLTLGKPVSNPKVTIAPGVLGAWYLRMDGNAPPVKVQRVD